MRLLDGELSKVSQVARDASDSVPWSSAQLRQFAPGKWGSNETDSRMVGPQRLLDYGKHLRTSGLSFKTEFCGSYAERFVYDAHDHREKVKGRSILRTWFGVSKTRMKTEFFMREMLWRSGWDSNPRTVSHHLISSFSCNSELIGQFLPTSVYYIPQNMRCYKDFPIQKSLFVPKT